jgi:hypothetical protein
VQSYVFINDAAPVKQSVDIKIPIKGILNQDFLARARYDKPITTDIAEVKKHSIAALIRVRVDGVVVRYHFTIAFQAVTHLAHRGSLHAPLNSPAYV